MATWKLGNVLIYDSDIVFSGADYNVTATHLTVNDCSGSLLTTYGDPESCTAQLENHVLVNIASLGSLEDEANNIDRSNLTPADLVVDPGFQPFGGGLHYLASGSAMRDTAPDAISSTTFPGLHAEIQRMTTWPPALIPGPITAPTTLGRNPNVPTDNDGLLDRGYHYPRLDWLATDLNVNAPLDITGGAAIGIVWPGDPVTYPPGVAHPPPSTTGGEGSGFHVNGVPFRSTGDPLNYNRFVPYQAVQEEVGAMMTGPKQFFDDAPVGAAMPEIRFRFTEINGLGGASELNVSVTGSTTG